METQITIARELGYKTEQLIERIEELCVEVGGMLAAMVVSLPKKS